MSWPKKVLLLSLSNTLQQAGGMSDIKEVQNLIIGAETNNHENEPFEFEGGPLPFELVNGYPMFQEGHVLEDKYQIFERIGWDDSKGATYLAMSLEKKELVIRIGNKDDNVVETEKKFLCKVDYENKWRHFSQVHSIIKTDEFTIMALYFRGGPTLKQCTEFVNHKFSHGTAGRFGKDTLEVLKVIHDSNYLIRDVSSEAFHLDACSRHLFLADISTLFNSEMEKKEKNGTNWVGGPMFAPMAFHDQEPITSRDELEAWFYHLIHLVKDLPWHGMSFDDIKWTKIQSINNGDLFTDLPKQYKEIYDIIVTQDSVVPVSAQEYADISSLLVQIYHNIGGIADHEDNFDFEREPEEDEIPRFVLEKKGKATEE